MTVLIETYDDTLLSASEIDRALEVAKNTGGWSFEEAELLARALVQAWDGAAIVFVRADETPQSDPRAEAVSGDSRGQRRKVTGEDFRHQSPQSQAGS